MPIHRIRCMGIGFPFRCCGKPTPAEVQDYLQHYLPDVPKLDFANGVNMEALLNANPDLIVLYTKQLAADGAIDDFKKIAPTYTFDDATVD
jgi:iron complex transport system substrate-binding protein